MRAVHTKKMDEGEDETQLMMKRNSYVEEKHWPFELAVAHFSSFSFLGVEQQMVLVLEPPKII